MYYYVWCLNEYSDGTFDWGEWLELYETREEALLFQQELEYIEGIGARIEVSNRAPLAIVEDCLVLER